MLQQLLLVLALAGALSYLGRIVYKSFKAENSCASGCGKCAETAQKIKG
jgi:hypothetical protein